MPNIKLNIDISDIANAFGEMKSELEADLKKGVGLLAVQTHAHVKELAAAELKSSLKKFQDSVGFEEIAPGVWVVSINNGGLWIEEGLPENFDMKPGLLKQNTKTSARGYQYRVIPFDHGKAPSQTNGYGQNLIERVKSELKQRKIPFKKIEKNENGSPRLGKLHSFNIDSEIPGKGNTPVLKGVTIYQSMNKETGKVRRDVMTFRTVSNSPETADKWKHPGLPAKKFLDRSSEWAMNTWENEILPSILDKWK